MIGYINRETAKILATEIDLGKQYRCKVSNIIPPSEAYSFSTITIEISVINAF